MGAQADDLALPLRMALFVAEPRVPSPRDPVLRFPWVCRRRIRNAGPTARSFLKMKRVIRPACVFPRGTGLVTATGLMGRVGVRVKVEPRVCGGSVLGT